MKTILYLDGIKAYISRFGVASPRVNKNQFETLIKSTDEVVEVVVSKETAQKYAKSMNRLGYILTNKTTYDMFTYKLTYKLVKSV